MSGLLPYLNLAILLTIQLVYFAFDAIIHRFTRSRKSLKKEVVLITGAGSGIGRLLSRKLVALGCCVVGWDISDNGLLETARLVQSDSENGSESKGSFRYYIVDITNRSLVYETAAKLQEPVDIVINNAGIISGSKFLVDTPDEGIQKTFEVNTLAHFWIMKAVLPKMLERNHGHVVTISSVAGLHGGARMLDYCSSKFAAVGFDDSLRWELKALGKDGIETTVVCPYVVDTGLFDGAGTNSIPYLMPVLKPEYVAERIIQGIQLNETQVYIPRSLHLFQISRLLVPEKLWIRAVEIMGLDQSMDNFKGRTKTE